MWAESYERDFRDVLSLQDEIACQVAGQVRIMLTPEEEARLERARPVDPQAHELLLKGRYHRNKRTEESVKRALSISTAPLRTIPPGPRRMSGWRIYNMLGYYCALAPHEAYPRAQSAARKALELTHLWPRLTPHWGSSCAIMNGIGPGPNSSFGAPSS